MAVGGGNGVAVGCGIFVGVGVGVGDGEGVGVAVGRGVGTGEGATTGAGVSGGTGSGVEEAGPFADSQPEALSGCNVAVGSSPAAGTADAEDATVGWRDAVDERVGIAAAVRVTGDNGEMSGTLGVT